MGCQVLHACRQCSVIFLAGLSLTLPGAPTFSTPQSTMDPVALAMSQVGLPTSSQTVLPSGLSSVGPQGNVHLGTVSIPGWSSVPPRLVRKDLEHGVRGHVEVPPKIVEVGPERRQLLPCPAAAARTGNSLLWTECFATLVAELATRYPEKTPHFMVYLRTITRASCNFKGALWAK